MLQHVQNILGNCAKTFYNIELRNFFFKFMSQLDNELENNAKNNISQYITTTTKIAITDFILKMKMKCIENSPILEKKTQTLGTTC